MKSDDELWAEAAAAATRIGTFVSDLVLEGIEPAALAVPLAHALGAVMAAAPTNMDGQLVRMLVMVMMDARDDVRATIAAEPAEGGIF